MRTSYLYILFLLIFSWGCITEYEDAGNGTLVDILAVEGIITNDTTYITLSKGVRLTDQINDLAYVNHAILSVECNDGTQMPSVLVGKGKYMVETRQLNPDKAYRLKILLDGEEYQSEYLTPLFTPEIDSISWKKEALGQPVHICVSTRDPQNQSHYYLWSYKEDWEIMAPLRGNARYIGGKLVWFTEENNRYYCWKSFESNSLSLGSTARLTDNKISELTLAQFNPSDNRFSVLYYIYVRQNMVRKEAHDYYANLKKNSEQTGSIFSPIPSEMKGNIVCTTNPDVVVAGFVEVSTTSVKGRFIERSENIYEPLFSHCYQNVSESPDTVGKVIYMFNYTGNHLWAPLECVDCTVEGTKKRPDFWPNNHH